MTISRKAIVIFSSAAIVVVVALILTSGVASAATHVVNQTSTACTGGTYYYTSIQAAVWNASSGDIIIVCPGRYNETVNVNKSNIVIKAYNETKPIVSAVNNPDDHVFNITDQTNVTLQGFEIRDANGTTKAVAGIYMYNVTECTIANNTVTNISAKVFNDAYGIYLYSSSNNRFNASTSVSTIDGYEAYGIYLSSSGNNTFNANITVSHISGSEDWAEGICLVESSNNRFNSSTSVSNVNGENYAAGISLLSSDNNTFSSSTSVSTVTASVFAYGIYLDKSSNNRFNGSTSVSNVTSTLGDAFGIALWQSNNNRFNSSTTVSNVTSPNTDAYGIYLYKSSNNRFSSSTSVSTITADDDARGIYLYKSSNNRFNSSTTVSTVTSTNMYAYGIFLDGSSNNNRFNASTTVSTVTSTLGDAYGIYLEDNSDDNTFTGITITPTINGSNYYEFFSEADCDDNVVTNMTIGNPTTISFTYGNGVGIKRVNVSERPGDPANVCNIGKYINASNVTPNSWLFVNFSYSQNDVLNWVDEETLKVWKYNGTAWNEDGWNGSRVLDTTNNVVGVNITRFCIFAPLGIPVASVTIPTATGSGDATINTSSGYFCDIPAALKASDLPSVPDSALTFLHGFFNLSICGLNDTIPETVTINFTFPSAIPTDAEFWKYNASNGTWYPFPFGDNDGDNVISITITDNGPGDHNPALGIIEDPNGVGWEAAAAEVPALTPIGLVVLVSVLSGIAATTITRNKGKRR